MPPSFFPPYENVINVIEAFILNIYLFKHSPAVVIKMNTREILSYFQGRDLKKKILQSFLHSFNPRWCLFIFRPWGLFFSNLNSQVPNTKGCLNNWSSEFFSKCNKWVELLENHLTSQEVQNRVALINLESENFLKKIKYKHPPFIKHLQRVVYS